jgi:photosystem II stability/assembly factor-like uncharacterized protein
MKCSIRESLIKSGQKRFNRLLFAASLLLSLTPVCAGIQVPTNPGHAWRALHAGQSLLLSISGHSKQMLWVAGERGHILKQSGADKWQQASVPAQVLLTAIDMFDAQHGWAVGHDALILKTVDGGSSWQEIYKDIEQQRPLLDVTFNSRQNGIAVGAYGYYLFTHDGGETWHDRLVNEEHDFHLNAISQNKDGDLYIAAEAGNLYRSVDAGESWAVLPSPYEGSFFDVLSWDYSHVVVAGLRGHLYHSTDKGENWRKIPSRVQTSLNSIIRLQNNQLLIVGHGGILLLVSADFSQTVVHQLANRKALADVYEFKQNHVLLVGEAGIRSVNLCDLFQSTELSGCQ